MKSSKTTKKKTIARHRARSVPNPRPRRKYVPGVLIHAGYPKTPVASLSGASRLVLARHQEGGSPLARFEAKNGKYYVIEIGTFTHEGKPRAGIRGTT